MAKPLVVFNEEQLRANRFELVSQLADDLAHELKNPLNAIVVNLEVLKVRASRGDTEAATQRVDVIEHEVRRLHHLMDRLLLLLRPDRDDSSSSALDQALDEVLPLIEAQARLARNELVVEGLLPIVVPLRRDLLKFALLNVLTAVHTRLGEGGGILRVVSRADDDRMVRIAILADPAAGNGMAPDDPSFQASCDVAAALLAASGGTLQRTPDGAVLVIPRVTAG